MLRLVAATSPGLAKGFRKMSIERYSPPHLIGNVTSMNTSSFRTMRARGFSRTVVLDRLKSIGLSDTDSFWLSASIDKWVKSNGIVETISWLKKLRLTVLHLWAQDDVVTPWVATKSGFPKAYHCLRKYSRSKIHRVLVIYKIFQFTRPTQAQVEKFVFAVRRSLPNADALERAKAYVRDGYIGDLATERKLTWKESPPPVVEYQVKQSFSRYGVPGLLPFRHSLKEKEGMYDAPFVEDRSLILEDALRVMALSPLRDMLYPERRALLAPLHPSARHRPLSEAACTTLANINRYTNRPFLEYAECHGLNHVGGIAATQEYGGKLRVFASPFPVLQCALIPFEKVLDSLMKLLPTDFRFDQESGARKVQSFLRSHPLARVFSIDLSNATDTFPLELQTDWMRHCSGIRPNLINLFEAVSKGSFWVDRNLTKYGFPEKLEWTVGQPLGTRGSFQSFSLTHSYLVRGIEKFIHGKIVNEFVVLGDDIVIFDERVKEEYLRVLTSLGISVAHDKTLSSYTAAEFAGYYIEGQSMTIPGKHKQMTDSNVRSQAQRLNYTARQEVTRVISDMGLVDAFSRLPKSIGGFGWVTNQSLATATTDVKLVALIQALAELKPEFQLQQDWPLKRVYQHVAGLLGMWVRDMDLRTVTPAMVSLTKLPIEVLDSVAYNWAVDKSQSLERESFALFEDKVARCAWVDTNKRRYSRICESILSRYWRRPGCILDTPERVVLEIAYQAAKDRIALWEKSPPLFVSLKFLPESNPEDSSPPDVKLKVKERAYSEQELMSDVDRRNEAINRYRHSTKCSFREAVRRLNLEDYYPNG